MDIPGILIAFEGIDGAGKTTQVRLLADVLQKAGLDVVTSKEPTDGPWGRKIRESAVKGRMSLEDELEAFVQDRREHVAELIQPSLARGAIVILDRYFYSTVTYQGSRGAEPESTLLRMLEIAPIPDITFLVDVDPVISMQRISISRGDVPNEFEKLEALTDIRARFLELATRDEVTTVDGHQSVERMHCRILQELIVGPLKRKRCGKPEGCEEVESCELRAKGNCAWFQLQAALTEKRTT